MKTSQKPQQTHIKQYILDAMKGWSGAKKLDAEQRALFVDEILHTDSIHDLQSYAAEEVEQTIFKLWQTVQNRQYDDIYIDVQEDRFGQADRVDIVIIQRQMPFITDSMLNLLRQNHLSVSVMINASLKMRRDDDGALLSIHQDGDFGPDLQTDKILYLQCENRGEAIRVNQLKETISDTLRDVHAAVEDWRPMQGQVIETINELEKYPAAIDGEDAFESAQFLTFLKDGHFTFLGYREHTIRREKNALFFDAEQGKSLGLLRDKEFLLFDNLITDERIPKEVQQVLSDVQPPLMVLKATRQATVHRNVHMDVILVKKYNDKGETESFRLFAGLFTAHCYAKPAEQIPYLKRKLNMVLLRSGHDVDTHAWRALKHVMESYSRDDLFQISTEDLYEHAVRINYLNNRPEIEVLVRKDVLQRYFSVLVFLPKEQYNTQLRLKTQTILEEELGSRVIAQFMSVDEKPLARLQYMLASSEPVLQQYDEARLRTRLIDACTPWFERLKIAALERFGKEHTKNYLQNMTHAFSVAYQDEVSIERALDDLQPLKAVIHHKDMHIELHRYESDTEGLYRIKFYKRDSEASLAELLPMLDRMGFKCINEYSYLFQSGEHLPRVWLHELVGTITDVNKDNFSETQALFADAFEMIWRGKIDSDSFNTLVLAANLTWREANLFRALARYLDLANYPLGKRYTGQVLTKYAKITQRLRDLFLSRMDPFKDAEKAQLDEAGLLVELDHLLESVEKIDEDRVLRSILTLIRETLRTNYFQTDAHGHALDILVLKFNAQNIHDLPQPRPYREMFVFSKRMEAVHLRGGPIARGGIRWSDRYEDFRTEILGLVKAQIVKNAVIVPVGAKGGFICKNSKLMNTPELFRAEGVACYQLMVKSFLSITDNLISGAVVPPADTIRHDGDDPYFVVAADKGTASFSDIANAISTENGFWLGDAFASGGSQGYDHKKMGITARGAWECIKRHFREMGKDIQSEEFTAVGVGDMSGDVFGNGMLLSEHTKLVAAFDHRHIFIDPTPDTKISFAERKRLFKLPGSSWMDYNVKFISKGGMIFNRQDKSLVLTPEIRTLLDIDSERTTPAELMQAILRANVELLYFGGIGTYLKSSNQTHEQVGDKGNDSIRVNANDLRCKVIGEGANLGVTQAARVEFSRLGGHINTDFIDNSGGVDTSDHEVNIKILLQGLVQEDRLSEEDRNALLITMTEEIAAHVLKNNYDQSLALSLVERKASESLLDHAGFMRALEKKNMMVRRLEGLPDDENIGRLQAQRLGMTRPELCVILAYSKIALFNLLMASNLPDDPALEHQLFEYFPGILQEKYAPEVRNHKLKREIIATEVANIVINRMGPVFVFNEMDRAGASADVICRALLLVRSVFDLRSLWNEIDKLDNKVDAETQFNLYEEITTLMDEGTQWFLQHHRNALDFDTLIPLYRDQLNTTLGSMMDTLPAILKQHIETKQEQLALFEAIRPDIRKKIAELPVLLPACDIIYMTKNSNAPAAQVAEVYFALNDRLRLETIDAQLNLIPADTSWAQEAIDSLKSEVQNIASILASEFMATGQSSETLSEWLQIRHTGLQAVDNAIADVERLASPDIALLAVTVQRLRRYVHKL